MVLAAMVGMLCGLSRCRSLPSTPSACEEAGGIWDAQHAICHDDQTAPRAMDRYRVPDRRPKASPESN